MSDTSNHYIGKSDNLRDLGAFLLAVVICAVLTVCCGCSRKVSENVEMQTTEQNSENGEMWHTVKTVEQSAAVIKTDGSLVGVLTRCVDDSLDVTLKVTEYGDDGQPKKVTEATLHRGKKDVTTGAMKHEEHGERVDVASKVVDDSTHLSMRAMHDETKYMRHNVVRAGWWAAHWRMVLAVVAAVVMVALVVWKRRRWLRVIVLWIRRFF